MSWIATAIIGGAVIGAVGSNMAASTQADAQKNAANQQMAMFNTITGQEQPFMQAGYGATSKLTDLLGTSGNTGAAGYGSLTSNFSPQDFLNNLDPGYGFQLKQGEQAVRNADTPGAGALSGGTLKDLMSFNQGLAGTAYNNAFNRFQTQNSNIFARLSGIAGLGQNAASNTGTAGTQLGIGSAQANAAAGGSLAGGIVGGTNALAGGANTLGGLMYLNANNSAPNSTYVNNVAANTAAGGGGAPSAGDWFAGGGYADGGPVRKMAMGGPLYGWGGPQQIMPGVPQTTPQALAPMMRNPWQTPTEEATHGPLSGVMDGDAGGGEEAINSGMPWASPTPQASPVMQQPRMGFGDIRGGLSEAMSAGGRVSGPGGPRDDKIPAMLSDGEHVVDAASVTAIGDGSNERGQEKLNKMRAKAKRRAHA